ncbi:MAG: hypothetical protein JNM17_13335 [Archangium sp.]|nr:hypothetical protein [Archangium sp.]
MLMTAALTIFLAQSSPPLVPSVTAEDPPPLTNEDDVVKFSDFVDRHLLSVTTNSGGAQVRTRARAFRLVDEDFETAFAQVPEAMELAHRAHQDAITASHLDAASMVLLGLSTGAVLVSTFVPAFVIPILVGSMVGLVVSLIIALVALPVALSAQERFFNAVSTHNHGLLDLRAAGGQSGGFGGMTVAF